MRENQESNDDDAALLLHYEERLFLRTDVSLDKGWEIRRTPLVTRALSPLHNQRMNGRYRKQFGDAPSSSGVSLRMRLWPIALVLYLRCRYWGACDWQGLEVFDSSTTQLRGKGSIFFPLWGVFEWHACHGAEKRQRSPQCIYLFDRLPDLGKLRTQMQICVYSGKLVQSSF